LQISFRDFGAPRDFERADTGITVFCERLERGTQDALLLGISGGGPIGADGVFHMLQK